MNGGNIIISDYENHIRTTGKTYVYRTVEDDLSDASHPIFFVDVTTFELEDNYEEGTFWFVASFSGNTDDDIHIVPRTILGETTTGNARIYNEETGWQPMLDKNTQTQQGVAFNVFNHATGGYFKVDSCNIIRNGEFICKIDPSDYEGGSYPSYITYTDHDAPDGINVYGIQNIVHDAECISDFHYCDVRKSYPPKNFVCQVEKLTSGMVNHLIWEEEDKMLGDDIQTFYEIYRKEVSEDNLHLIKSIAKVDGQDIYKYDDLTEDGEYEYRINTFNIYETGSSESQYSVAETEFLSVSEIDNNSTDISVYPTIISNNEIVSIESGSEIKDVKMTDILGRNVNISINQTENSSCQIGINQKCNPGIYLIIVETQEGVCYKKVILE